MVILVQEITGLVHLTRPTRASDIAPKPVTCTAAGNAYGGAPNILVRDDGDDSPGNRSLCAADSMDHVPDLGTLRVSRLSAMPTNHGKTVRRARLAGPLAPCGRWGNEIRTSPAWHG